MLYIILKYKKSASTLLKNLNLRAKIYLYGALVKWLRRGPLKAEARVQFSYASPVLKTHSKIYNLIRKTVHLGLFFFLWLEKIFLVIIKIGD